MPNGKPGNHPLTDIVAHNIDVSGSEIDDKIRRIRAASPSSLGDRLAAVLLSWPRWNTDIAGPVLNPEGLTFVLDTLLAHIRRHYGETDRV